MTAGQGRNSPRVREQVPYSEPLTVQPDRQTDRLVYTPITRRQPRQALHLEEATSMRSALTNPPEEGSRRAEHLHR